MTLAQELKETADRWHSEKVEIPKELLMELKQAAENGAYIMRWYRGVISDRLKSTLEGEGVQVKHKMDYDDGYYELTWK